MPLPYRETAFSLRGKILAAALQDGNFRASLLANAKRAVEQRFGAPVGYNIRVHEEQPREFTILIPYHTEDCAAHVENAVAEFERHGTGPTRGQLECMIVKKASDFEPYRRALEENPREVLNAELTSHGGPLPDDVYVTLLTEAANECVVVLPSASISSGELSAAELESVAAAAFPVAWIVAAVVSPVGQATVGSTVGSVVGSVVGSTVVAPEGRRDD